MVRRTKRSDRMTDVQKAEHLEALGNLRAKCTRTMAKIRPFGQEYVHIMKFIETIDQYQYFWTQDEKYFHDKGSNGGTGRFDGSNKS